MNPTDQQLDYARDLCQQGRIDDGKRIYLDIYTRDPSNFRVLANLGAIELNAKNYEKSIEYFRQAIESNSTQPIIYYNLGRALHEIKIYDEAISHYKTAIDLHPNFAEAYLNLGLTLISQENHLQALEQLNKAVELNHNNPDAYNNIGVTLHQLGRYKDAEDYFNKAIQLKPDYAQAYSSRGLSLFNMGLYENALNDYQKAIQLNLNEPEIYNNLGLCLYNLKSYEAAIKSYDQAIHLKPNYAEAFSNRGLANNDIGKYENALNDYQTALQFMPDFTSALNNLGLTLYRIGQYEEALSNFEKAISLKPKEVLGYWNKSLVKLLMGEYNEGWKLYEQRWDREGFEERRHSDVPLWTGSESLENKTLLIWPEQGQGDIIQFSRYALLAKNKGAKVTLEAPRSLITLLSGIDAEIKVIEERSSISHFDFQSPMMSLPYAFKTTVETIPSVTPYIHANTNKVAEWEKRLGTKSSLRVGLVWSGSSIHKNDINRSIPLEKILPITDLPIEYHSLQVQYKGSDLELLNSTSKIIQHQSELKDFSDTAALIENMDLIISVDTSVAHLAGAMGKPTWILLPYVPDFRWMLNRQDTPWYPTAQLFRQPQMLNWDAVIIDITNNLKKISVR